MSTEASVWQPGPAAVGGELPAIGDRHPANVSRVAAYAGDRRVVLGVDEYTSTIKAYVLQAQPAALAAWRTERSTTSRARAGVWLAGARVGRLRGL